MIDTNTVSYIVTGRSKAARTELARLSGTDAGCISAVTEAEIRYGLSKNPSAVKWHAAIEAFLLKIRILPWGSPEAFAYGYLRARLERIGKTLGNLDLLIAAHATAVGAVLVTNDRTFLNVEELRLVNWATDLGKY